MTLAQVAWIWTLCRGRLCVQAEKAANTQMEGAGAVSLSPYCLIQWDFSRVAVAAIFFFHQKSCSDKSKSCLTPKSARNSCSKAKNHLILCESTHPPVVFHFPGFDLLYSTNKLELLQQMRAERTVFHITSASCWAAISLSYDFFLLNRRYLWCGCCVFAGDFKSLQLNIFH